MLVATELSLLMVNLLFETRRLHPV